MQTYNVEYIKSFKPCKSGLDNFVKHYPKFDDKLSKLLALKKIPYNDKVWLALRTVPVKTLQMWSVLCAESVLPNYEKHFPNDSTIRDCLETVKKVINGVLPLSAAESAARSAAWSAESAARSAWSAESAARSAWSAARSAWSAAWSAESAAWSAESAWSSESEKKQEELNIKILIKLLKEEGL